MRGSRAGIFIVAAVALIVGTDRGAQAQQPPDESGRGPTFYARAGGGFAVTYGGRYDDTAGLLPPFFGGTRWDVISDGDFTASLAAGVRLDTTFPLTIEIEYRWLRDEFSEVRRGDYYCCYSAAAGIDAELESHILMANLLFEFDVRGPYTWRWYGGGGVGWIDTTFDVHRIGGTSVSVPSSKESNFGGQLIFGAVFPVNRHLEFYTSMTTIFGVNYDSAGFGGNDVAFAFELGLRVNF